jgi:hypothetical protein
MAAVVFLAPRRVAALAVFAAVCYLGLNQRITVAGFNFTAARVVLLAGFLRTLARGELRKLKLTNIDRPLLAFAIFSALMEGLRLGVWQERVGIAYNVLLSYFVFRCLITSLEEMWALLPKIALLIIPLAVCMVVESSTGKNLFSVIGAADQQNTREGRLRCVGSFRGPHTAGIFGATLMPMFAALFCAGRQRRVAVAGLVAATAITYTSNSSGPLMAYASGLVGFLFWPLRRDMKRVRWGILATLAGLALVMKAPIWYLIAKISALTGGDGWHRSYLMAQCFKHFFDWWLVGTSDTSDWAVDLMPWGGADITNMYVACAASAGLGSLVLFVLILVRCFGNLGRALKAAREMLPESEGLLWCCGTVLFAHVVTFFSVTYWDQLHVVWWGLLAMISSVTSDILKPAPATEVANEILEPVPSEAACQESIVPPAWRRDKPMQTGASATASQRLDQSKGGRKDNG